MDQELDALGAERQRKLLIDYVRDFERDRKSVPVTNNSLEFKKAVEWLAGADRLLISAGAGLSCAAGLDFNSDRILKTVFKDKNIPPSRSNLYDLLGTQRSTGFTVEANLGYILYLFLRKNYPQTKVYQKLKNLILPFQSNNNNNNNSTSNNNDNKSYFIVTSNFDGLFEQNSFFIDHCFYSPQGDLAKIQCNWPCSQSSVWDTQRVVSKIEPGHLFDLLPIMLGSDLVDKCPKCLHWYEYNVNISPNFIDAEYKEQKSDFEAWKEEARVKEKKVVILEIGVGMNTPAVLRWPNERLVEEGGGRVKLIRVNVDKEDAYVPNEELGGNAVSLNVDALTAIEMLSEGLGIVQPEGKSSAKTNDHCNV